MKAKVAVIGPEDTVIRIQQLKKESSPYELLPFTYTESSETPALLEQSLLCNIFLFTESIAYLYVKEIVEKRRLSIVVVDCDEYNLTTSLLQLCLNEQPYTRFSLDGVTKDVVQRAQIPLNSTGVELLPIYEEEVAEKKIESILNHHRNYWASGRTEYALTAYKEIARQLEAENIAVWHMDQPDSCYKLALEKLEKRIAFHTRASTQIVIGYFRFKHVEQMPTSLKAMILYRRLSELELLLQAFASKQDAILLRSDQDGVVIIGSRKLLDYLSKHYTKFPLIRKIKEHIQEPVGIGFGLGFTSLQAHQHAMMALEKTAEEQESSCYIVNESQVKLGPLGVKKHINASFLYQALIHEAKLNNELSYNFIEFITLRNNKPFSSSDVADYYRVTKRSAERTINKLLSAEIIKIAGTERPYQRGRPRKLFALL
ncbi:hypothetical protein [Oceanobacillus kapialis]|uniref:HTH domain-containing protein n=1 Tax=Oceanobacillus kapialis TaxID=481353 RepID=A0ABW5Q264_9BACI